ncbi:hypothetical protein Pmani_026028 [Petrolisthes manimaculis]|uniref:Uncharacterized protein n=1 Tax=Petrolisthes manimaculis TaxID=1843537 RepID=A0AAE1P5I3_9EUCA|nr:hypothetical protein Pmani_026028 [Petrolisthes manimaculis]
MWEDRLELLKKRNQDVYRAALWLESNANQFTAKIHVESVKQSWVPHITSLVNDISTKFSKFMAGVGYAGEVTLSVPEDPNTFISYGISIKVSFRDHQHLKELTAQY